MELPTAEIGRWRVLANCSAAPEARVRRHEGSLTTVQAVVPKHQETNSTTLVTCSAPQPSVVPRRHAARCCGVQQQCRRRPQLHDQAKTVRTTHADTIAATAACCGRSVAELQGRWQRFGWESQPTGLAPLSAKSGGGFRTSVVHRAVCYQKAELAKIPANALSPLHTTRCTPSAGFMGY